MYLIIAVLTGSGQQALVERIATFSTSTFSMSIRSDCTAVATFAGADADAVPFLSLFNPPRDSRPSNLSPCVSAELVNRSLRSSGAVWNKVLLSITAAHGYGSVEISVEARPAGHIFFSVTSLAGWTVHPPDRHLQFGEFWSGLLSNATAPIVMGRLQGPRAIPGSAVASAGFIAVTAAAYYKWIFAASVGDELAFAVSDPRERSAGVAATWLSVASDREWPRPSPNRFLSWFWTDLTEAAHSAAGARAAVLGVDTVMLLNKWHEPGDELAVSESSFPSGIGATVEALRNTHGLRVGLHMHPDIVWPCDGGATAGLDCFSTGVGISKTVLRHPDALLQEGLSPTFRSGKFNVPSEDVAFYWGHDPGHWPDVSPDEVASVAHNGNPVPCGQGSCNPHDWPSNAWAPDLNLSSARWSPVGRYRGGFSIAFSGDSSSRGETPWWRGLDDITTGLTVGIVVHAPITGAPLSSSNDASNAVRTLCSRNGSWSLGVTPAGLPRLDVYTTLGQVSVIGEKTDAIKPGTVRMIKGTYNATSGSAKLFVDGRLAAAAPKPLPGGKLLSSEDSSAPRGSAAVGTGLVVGAGFAGSIEELYIKNVSTENRPGYVYADSNRVAGTFLLDLDTDAGRALFAARVAAVTRLANFSAVQYDGFEKLQLIAALDFAHSAKTATSGLFRGPPTPDWYHYQGWPLRVGQGILSGIAAAHEKMPSAGPAVECSFVAPGSGSGRPDMAPYVDEREDRNASLDPNGFVLLGLQWHSKMLQRVEITGIAVNPYNTQLDRLETLVELDYWFGGLVATGVAPQPQGNFEAGRFDAAVGEWIRLYRRLGHLQEHLVQTLTYDTMCCHVQGDCEWDVCEDSITTRFAGGSLQRSPPTGLYIGSSRVVTVPSGDFMPTNTTLVVFRAYSVAEVSIEVPLSTGVQFGLTVLSSPGGLRLGGAWWHLRDENVLLTTVAANGRILSQIPIFQGPVTGRREWRGTSANPRADGGIGRLEPVTLWFKKVSNGDSGWGTGS